MQYCLQCSTVYSTVLFVGAPCPLQLDQRKGRTGRTCSGVVYRLVPRSLQGSFLTHELPSMQRLSLRKQTLMLACAESRAISDPPCKCSVLYCSLLYCASRCSCLRAPRAEPLAIPPVAYCPVLIVTVLAFKVWGFAPPADAFCSCRAL